MTNVLRELGIGLALLAGSLLAIEVGLRCASIRPALDSTSATHTGIEPDLGWKNRPGTAHFPRHDGSQSTVTVLPSGQRVTSSRTGCSEMSSCLLVLGCSYTFGSAYLDDNQTYPWKLQALRPDFTVENAGVPAYGTYQSLLVLEQSLAKRPAPAAVVYGFVDFHEFRNVAERSWLQGLTRASSDPVAIPYATLSTTGQLEEHKPIRYPRLPLHSYSALVSLIEDLIGTVQAHGREEQSMAVTVALVTRMRDRVEAQGSRFLPVMLHSANHDPRELLAHFRAAGIELTDCTIERNEIPRLTIAEDGHPSGELNQRWAACIGRALRQPNGAPKG